jgi:hypothetical protein
MNSPLWRAAYDPWELQRSHAAAVVDQLIVGDYRVRSRRGGPRQETGKLAITSATTKLASTAAYEWQTSNESMPTERLLFARTDSS